MLTQRAVYQLTIADYEAIAENITQKTELLYGEILMVPPVGWTHTTIQKNAATLLNDRFPNLVYTNGSIRLGQNTLLEPDITVFKALPHDVEYPEGAQVSLVVEVAVTTLRTDTLNDGTGKLSAYAMGGIPEIWVVDVEGKELHRYTSPDSRGIYACHVREKTGIIEQILS
ncbi:Hypothetical protein HDN1F_30900 [gamma proteobacterium HdN1]|nr:Hypothetical protein HDN1F_30900 [gamma proteobacterium HdN1]